MEAGRWEPGTLAVVEACVGPGTAFLDLGAWVGPLSLYAAALGADVTAVEADPAALEQLRRNLQANPDLARRVSVVPRAVAASGGTVRFGARRKPGDSMSSVLLAEQSTARWDADAVTPVELTEAFPRGCPLFVKLDIEGGEYALLPSLVAALTSQDARILVSFHPGILAETGRDDPAGAALRAADALGGHETFAIGPAGAVRHAFDRPALASYDTWLFGPARA